MTLQVGDPAPDFTMSTVSGGTVSLGDLRGKKVVLYFYPKDDTPGCTIEACAFRDNLPNFEGANAEIIGVSRDNTESHQKFRDKYGLNFTLASDDTGQVTEDYGVWREKNMYGNVTMGIVRSTYLIDEDGKIAKIWPSVKVDGHAQEVLAAVNGNEPSVEAPAAAPPAATPRAAKPRAAKPRAAKKAAKPKVAAKKAAKPKAAAKKAPAKKAVKAKAAKKPAKKAAAKAKPAKKTTRKPAKKAAAKSRTAKTAKKPAKKAAASRSGARRSTAAGRRTAARRTAARRRR
jgi:peroxiredoxin Q/BCP